MIGPFEVGMNVPWLLGGATKLFCPPILTSEVRTIFSIDKSAHISLQLCKDVIELFAGPTGKAINWVGKIKCCSERWQRFQTRAPVYFSNLLVSTSSWNVLQYMQVCY